MNTRTRLILLCALLVPSVSAAWAQPSATVDTPKLSIVSPALESYTKKDLFGRVWQEKVFSMRDRGLVTVAALIARDQTEALPAYIGVALDNGVKPAEISETITHLAFYAGWPNAFSALPVFREVFASRKQS